MYVSVAGGMAFGMASIPLYYELGVDLSYPVPEILVSGLITASDNISSSLFLLVFLIPGIGECSRYRVIVVATLGMGVPGLDYATTCITLMTLSPLPQATSG